MKGNNDHETYVWMVRGPRSIAPLFGYAFTRKGLKWSVETTELKRSFSKEHKFVRVLVLEKW